MAPQGLRFGGDTASDAKKISMPGVKKKNNVKKCGK
jgi:hypothetical protein